MTHKEFHVILRVKADLANPATAHLLTEKAVEWQLKKMLSFSSILNGLPIAGKE